MSFTFQGRALRMVGVVGSGQIGPDIALFFAKVLAPFQVPVVVVDVAQQALDRGRERLRQLTRRTRHGTLEEIIQDINQYTTGWMGYFRLADTPSVFAAVDEWLRRRLRQLVWKRWKRGKTRWRELVALGVPPDKAGLGAVGKSPWRMAASPVVHMGLSNAYWRKQGLHSIAEQYHRLRFA